MLAITRIGKNINRDGYTFTTVRSCELSDGKFIPILKIMWAWVCADCLHGLLVTDDDVVCPSCGSHNIVRREKVAKERLHGMAILRGLPEELRQTVMEAQPDEAQRDLLWGTGIDETTVSQKARKWRPMELPEDLRKI